LKKFHDLIEKFEKQFSTKFSLIFGCNHFSAQKTSAYIVAIRAAAYGVISVALFKSYFAAELVVGDAVSVVGLTMYRPAFFRRALRAS